MREVVSFFWGGWGVGRKFCGLLNVGARWRGLGGGGGDYEHDAILL